MGTAYPDRFEILNEIGEGGFARVFAARELTSGRKVALKVLKDTYRHDPEIVERFRREVFAVASISSPHVVQMHDFGISGDGVYIAMEFVEGLTLREVAFERRWTADEIHLVVGQIAQALAAAHRQDIVHRDLKPENVMLVGSESARHVKVLDFGLAKLAELERTLGLQPLTRAGMTFGTPQYMAPELIRGKPIDRSVDLYALGVIVFELVAGFLPWDAPDVHTILDAVIKQPPPKLPPNPSLPTAALDRFVQRALAKQKAQRFPDAPTFFQELELALFGAPRPPKPGVQVPPADAAFASVWAASIELDSDEEHTTVDAEARRFSMRRLSSGWMPSLEGDEAAWVEHATTVEASGPPRPSSDEELTAVREDTEQVRPRAHGFDEGRSEGTETLKDPRPRPRMLMWLIPFLLALVAFATALGWYVGQRGK